MGDIFGGARLPNGRCAFAKPLTYLDEPRAAPTRVPSRDRPSALFVSKGIPHVRKAYRSLTRVMPHHRPAARRALGSRYTKRQQPIRTAARMPRPFGSLAPPSMPPIRYWLLAIGYRLSAIQKYLSPSMWPWPTILPWPSIRKNLPSSSSSSFKSTAQ